MSVHLSASSKLAGMRVFDRHGERVGHLDEIMIDKATGRIAYAVLALGGFLGINDAHHPLPWSALRYDAALDGYVLETDAKALGAAPTVGVGGAPDGPDGPWAEVDEFYREGGGAETGTLDPPGGAH